MGLARSALGMALALAVAAPATAGAQRGLGQVESDRPVREVPGLDQVDVDEQLGAKMPLDLTFTDHTGQQVQLGELFDGERPVLLTFNYFTCPVLCSMVLDATATTMNEVPWTAGDEYEIVTISIDPRDTPERAAEKRAEMLDKYGRSSKGWHFLVGDEASIAKATEAAGIKYFYNEAQDQYAHPAVVTFLTPAGKLARYLYGLQLDTSDARLALLEASKGNTLSSVEKVIISCYRYDPDKGGYALFGWRVMQFGAGATAVVLGTVLAVLWRRERRKRRSSAEEREAHDDSAAEAEHHAAHG